MKLGPDESVLKTYELPGLRPEGSARGDARNFPLFLAITNNRLLLEVRGAQGSIPLSFISGVEIASFKKGMFGSKQYIYLAINTRDGQREVFGLREINPEAMDFRDTLNSMLY